MHCLLLLLLVWLAHLLLQTGQTLIEVVHGARVRAVLQRHQWELGCDWQVVGTLPRRMLRAVLPGHGHHHGGWWRFVILEHIVVERVAGQRAVVELVSGLLDGHAVRVQTRLIVRRHRLLLLLLLRYRGKLVLVVLRIAVVTGSTRLRMDESTWTGQRRQRRTRASRWQAQHGATVATLS